MIGAVSLLAYDLSTLSLFNFNEVHTIWSFPAGSNDSSSLVGQRVLDLMYSTCA